jgi:hypothetical protein
MEKSYDESANWTAITVVLQHDPTVLDGPPDRLGFACRGSERTAEQNQAPRRSIAAGARACPLPIEGFVALC